MFKKLIILLIFTCFLVLSPISAMDFENDTSEMSNINLASNNYIIENNVIDEEYVGVNVQNNLLVNDNNTKQDPNILVYTNTTCGGAVTINISANINATGNITLTTAGKTVNTKLVNGSAIETLNLTPGIYSIHLTYSGDDNFEKFDKYYFQKYMISDVSTSLVTPYPNLVMFYKNGTRFQVDLLDSRGKSLGTPDVKSLNKYVHIFINGAYYEKRVAINGTFLNLNLRPGNYVIKTVFEGTPLYPPSNLTTNLTVLSDLVAENLTKYYKNASQFMVKVIDGQGNPLDNKVVKLNINGVWYTKNTNNEGIAQLNINLLPGEYIITVIHPDTGLDMGYMIKVLPSLIGEDVTLNYKNGSQYLVKALDGQGNPIVGKTVKLNINGVIYDKITDNEGIAHLNINLYPGDYIVTATHPDTGLEMSNNVKVLSPNMVINGSFCGDGVSNSTLLKYSSKYSSNSYIAVDLDVQTNVVYRGESLNIYLKSNQNILNWVNIPIQITVNGVTYTRYTDNYGIAKLNINLNAQNNPYLVNLHLEGTSEYSSDSKSCYLYVNQKNTLLTIMSNVIHKGNTLKIKLTDSTHVPIADKAVKITINGVTYERRSNQYGLTLLNINLNPGSYVVSTSFDSQSGYSSFAPISKTISVLANTNNLKSIILTPLNNALNRGDYYKVKLTDESTGNLLIGKTVAITINGVTYYKISDSNGIAQLRINLNFPNTYTVVSNFEGDSSYLSTSNYNIVHVTNPETDKNYDNDWPLEWYKTASNEYCDYSSDYVQNLANSITSTCSNDLEKSIAIHNYVYRMIYSGYSGPKNPALNSLLLFRGNCVDKTSSLIALSRAIGLPVNYVVGFGVGEAPGHAWAQICINNFCIVSDPTNTLLFGDWYCNQGPYVNLTRGLLITS